MSPEVGVFKSRFDAERGIASLFCRWAFRQKIDALTPASTDSQIAATPVSDTEQPGMGEALGKVVGGALGVAGGLGAGAALASLMVPGAGQILAAGLLGASLLRVDGRGRGGRGRFSAGGLSLRIAER